MNVLVSMLILVMTGPAMATAELAQKKGCMACHAVDRKVLGPSFRDVAAKYAGQDMVSVERSIREGGSGRWGPVPMPAQPQVTAAEAQALARWISSVK